MISKPFEAPGGRSFAKTIKYIRGLSHDFDRGVKVEFELSRNLINGDIETAIEDMQFVASTGKSDHAAYHFALSWREGEKPTREQVEACLDHSLKALGMDDLQAVAGLHKDTDNYHLHVCVNRIDYRTGHVRPIDQDRMKLDRACREMELQHGWMHDNGPHIINEKGEIVRKPRDPNAEYPLDRGSRALEDRTGEMSFKTWAKERGGAELKAVALAAGSWDDLHRGMAKYNLEIKPDPNDKGLSIVDRDDDKYHSPASHIARELSRGNLEKRLGPWQEPSPEIRQIAAEIDYKNDPNKGLAQEPEEKQLRREFKEYEQEYKRIRPELKAIDTEWKAGQKEATAWRKEQEQAIKESGLTGSEKARGRAIIKAEAARRRAEVEDRATEKREALGIYGTRSKLDFTGYLQYRAQGGNETAIAILRTKKRFEVTLEGEGMKGEDGSEKKAPLKVLDNLEIKVSRHGNVSFYDATTGAEKYRDAGRQLLFLGHTKNDPAAIQDGLRYSREKFGAAFELTGSMEWKKLAAAQAIELGITITNKELQPYIAELKKAQGIGQEIKGRELLPRIKEEIKAVDEQIGKNEKWLAASGGIVTAEEARAKAESDVTNGLTTAVKAERDAIKDETRRLATEAAPIPAGLIVRIAQNEEHTTRLNAYLNRPEVQKRIEGDVAKVEANNQVIRDVQAQTADLKGYRADLKKVEKTLASDKKDRAYKLEAGTDPRDPRQIVNDPTFRQQVNRVQKDLDKAKGIER